MTKSILLGVIADDLADASDLALMLARNGLKTVQVIGVPAEGADFGDADAVVVALQCRSIPADQAVAMALASALVLRSAGAEQFMYAYASTFNSTDLGNIGPVAEALMDLLDVAIAIACPAAPSARHAVFQGHLFVGSRLLSESAMGEDPQTPMTDSNLVRVLQAQTSGRVGLLPLDIVSAGADAINAVVHKAGQAGFRLMIADATRDADLRVLGKAMAGARLITGSVGLAGAMARNFREQGRVAVTVPEKMAAPAGLPVVLVGSCSETTRSQVEAAIAAGLPSLQIVPADIVSGKQVVADVANWVLANTGKGKPAVIYSSADPQDVQAVHDKFGREEAGLLVEHMLANLAVILRDNGFTRFLIAGDDSAEALLAALEVRAVQIGPEIAPDVPWLRSIAGPDLALTLKSGNAGGPDLFQSAWAMLEG